MEVVVIMVVLGSIFSNIYLINKIKDLVDRVNIPAPIINVTVEESEPVELVPVTVESVGFDYEWLERVLEGIASRPVAPIVIPNPQSLQYPEPWQYPIVSDIIYNDGHNNEVEIDGVMGRQFPLR